MTRRDKWAAAAFGAWVALVLLAFAVVFSLVPMGAPAFRLLVALKVAAFAAFVAIGSPMPPRRPR